VPRGEVADTPEAAHAAAERIVMLGENPAGVAELVRERVG
jgi:hypothetical protein